MLFCGGGTVPASSFADGAHGTIVLDCCAVLDCTITDQPTDTGAGAGAGWVEACRLPRALRNAGCHVLEGDDGQERVLIAGGEDSEEYTNNAQMLRPPDLSEGKRVSLAFAAMHCAMFDA